MKFCTRARRDALKVCTVLEFLDLQKKSINIRKKETKCFC